MTEIEFETGLNNLKNILEEIKGLLAWQQLKQQETRPHQIAGFILEDSVDQDLRDQYSAFLANSLQIHRMLDNIDKDSVSLAKQRYYRQQLFELERQVHALNLAERFINL